MDPMSIVIPVSAGELLDKISILQIKEARIEDPAKRANVQRELALLRAAWQASPAAAVDVGAECAQLERINAALWEIEDAIRACEQARRFDARFIELARAVYQTNDRRAAVKRRLNEKLGSALVEEKSYTDYAPPPA